MNFMTRFHCHHVMRDVAVILECKKKLDCLFNDECAVKKIFYSQCNMFTAHAIMQMHLPNRNNYMNCVSFLCLLIYSVTFS